MSRRFKRREATQGLAPVSNCGRGADLPLQGVWSGTDELLYLPLQGGLGHCTQTHTGAQMRQHVTCIDTCAENYPTLKSQSRTGGDNKTAGRWGQAFSVCVCVCATKRNITILKDYCVKPLPLFITSEG